MTTALRPDAAPEQRGGTVFDIGYQRYDGVREGRDRARRAILKDSVRSALGFGRGAKAKVLPWFFIGVLSFIGTVMALVAGAAERMGGPGTAERAGLPSHVDFNGFASIILFVFAAVIAPELLCRDRRDGVIHLYLVRPITGSDYITSRWLACFAVLYGAAIIPQVILFLGLVAYAAIARPFTVGLAQEIDGPVGQWISMFSLTNIPLHVNDVIFGRVGELTEDAPARELGSAMLVSWFFAWTIVPTVVLWWRYRRLAA